MQRDCKDLGDNIIARKEIFQVGSGEFDRIGINRIAKKGCRFRSTVVMVPGSNSDFSTSFAGMAKYLASVGIDVWGIDFRYSFVPDSTDSAPYCLDRDCGFMKDWNTDMHLSDLDLVVKLAELAALDKVVLIGFSQGAYFAYRYASRNVRQLKGMVAMDIAYNLDLANSELIEKVKAEVNARKEKMTQGIYYEDVLAEKYIGELAYNNPDDQSPVIQGLTNRQALLFAVTATYQLPAFSLPGYRYTQGDLTGLKYTDYDFILGRVFDLNSFQSLLPMTGLYEQWTEEKPQVPEVAVPLFHIGAEFGFGQYGLYTPEAISKSNPNVKSCLITDYGHADLVYSKTAKYEVWEKIVEWVKNLKHKN